MGRKSEGRLYYLLVERLHNRRISLVRYEDNGTYRLQLVTCLSKQDAAERAEESKTAGLPINLIRGRILVTDMNLSAEAMRAIGQLWYSHEKYAEERRELKGKRQQRAIMRPDDRDASYDDETTE